MELIAVAVIAVSVVGIVVRSIWEKRAGIPAPEDGEAVGGWFGGLRD